MTFRPGVDVAVEKFCVVCGIGSHRIDWQDAAQPACDKHSEAEVAKAVSDAAVAKQKAADAAKQAAASQTTANKTPAPATAS